MAQPLFRWNRHHWHTSHTMHILGSSIILFWVVLAVPSRSQTLNGSYRIIPIPGVDEPVRVAAHAASGTIWIAGTFRDSIQIDDQTVMSQGGTDAFVACMNTQLQVLWLQSFGGPGDDAATALDVGTDNHAVVALYCGAASANVTTYTIGPVTYSGRGNADAVIVAINSDGSIAWSRNDGADMPDIPRFVHILQNNNVLIAGYFLYNTRMSEDWYSTNRSLPCTYVQLLNSDGNQKWSAAALALHSDGERSSVIPVGLLNADGPRIAIPVNSVGLFSWASDTIRHSDQAQQEQVFLTLDISGATQPAVTGNVCWKENAVWGPPSTTFGVSMTSDDWCTTAEPPSILFTSMLAEQQQRIAFGTMNVSRIVGTQNRLFIAGSYSNSIDLVSTPLSPDVSNSNSSYDGIVLLFHPQGTEQAVFTTESSDAAHVSDIATLSNGAVLAIRGHGTLSGVNGAPTLTDNDWLIVSAHQLTVSVDHDTLYLKRGFDPDEKTFVYDLCGRSLGYIPTVRNAWEYLEQGVYLLRQEQTLSLCHVGSHNVSFALPTGASR